MPSAVPAHAAETRFGTSPRPARHSANDSDSVSDHRAVHQIAAGRPGVGIAEKLEQVAFELLEGKSGTVGFRFGTGQSKENSNWVLPNWEHYSVEMSQDPGPRLEEQNWAAAVVSAAELTESGA